MRFNVPQFIDVEDKIFGPLTFRQFVYLTGGGGLAFLAFKALPLIFAILVGVPLAAFGVALAFVKINNKPLINTIEAAFNYGINDKLYIWKHEKKKLQKSDEENKALKPVQYLPRISESKLHDIAWGLDVLDKRS
jgi:hypothetical protein